MKRTKIIIAILTVILLLSSLSVISFASDDTLRIADDYSYVTYGGEKYVRVSSSRDNVNFIYAEYNYDFTVEYTEKQLEQIEGIDLSVEDVFLELRFRFVSGGSATEWYLKEEFLDEYNSVANLTAPLYRGGGVKTEKDAIFGETVKISSTELISYNWYLVDNRTEDGFCYHYCGRFYIATDGSCYYLDFAENGSNYHNYDLLDFDELTVHKITDPEICEKLCVKSEPTEKSRVFIYATMVMIGLFFGILPLALGILCFMKRKSAKEPYRRLYTILMSACAVAVVLLIILAAIVLPYL